MVQAWRAFRYRAGYDVILTDGEHVGIPLALLLKLRGARTGHVTIAHRLSAPKKRLFFRWLRVHTHMGRIAVHARRQREIAQADLGIPAHQLAFVPYQVDPSYWQPRPAVQEERLVVSAGLEFRDYSTLIRAVDGLDAQVIIGAASHWSHRRNTAANVELPCNVQVSAYDYEGLRSLYARAAIVVVPLAETDFQAGVTTILEAMAMGKAVVVSHTEGQTDVVQDRRTATRGARPRCRPVRLLGGLAADAGLACEPNGFYVAPGDPAELRRAITYLLDQPARRRQLGEAGRRLVEHVMTVDHYALRLRALVEQVHRELATTHADSQTRLVNTTPTR
jgi:glycosyltransferase involved in cell wall biosynthesis